MRLSSSVGFVGTGNLASAIIKGLCLKGDIKPENIYIYDINSEKVREMSKYRVSVSPTPADISQKCDFIFLTVKPDVYETALRSLLPLSPEKCVINVGAGVSIDFVKSVLGFDAKVIRVMPNTPLLVGAGASGLVHEPPVSGEEFSFIFDIFASLGFAAKVDEKYINAVTALSGSAPAYFFRLAELAMEFAEEQGLDPETALNLFAGTMAGSAKMIFESGSTPAELVRAVSSPGGTTVAALNQFEKAGLHKAFKSGLKSCINRAEELGR